MKNKKAEVIPITPPDVSGAFFRIATVPLAPGDTFPGYQVERVDLFKGKVIEYGKSGKPNFFEYTQSHMIDITDPRNHVEKAKASDFV